MAILIEGYCSFYSLFVAIFQDSYLEVLQEILSFIFAFQVLAWEIHSDVYYIFFLNHVEGARQSTNHGEFHLLKNHFFFFFSMILASYAMVAWANCLNSHGLGASM